MDIVHLPRERYAGYAFPFDHESDFYYDISQTMTADGFCVAFARRPFETPYVMRGEDALYEEGWDDPSAWGILKDGGPVALLEITPVRWNGQLRVLHIWVDKAHRRQGLGKRLMAHAKAIAIRDGHRAVVLETQNSNDRAIAFYLSEGFAFSGYDLYAYTNDDVARRSVRLEMTWLPPAQEEDA